MNYQDTKAALDAMTNLETYSKMWQQEMGKDNPDWTAMDRYSNYIEVARNKLFDMIANQETKS